MGFLHKDKDDSYGMLDLTPLTKEQIQNSDKILEEMEMCLKKVIDFICKEGL